MHKGAAPTGPAPDQLPLMPCVSLRAPRPFRLAGDYARTEIGISHRPGSWSAALRRVLWESRVGGRRVLDASQGAHHLQVTDTHVQKLMHLSLHNQFYVCFILVVPATGQIVGCALALRCRRTSHIGIQLYRMAICLCLPHSGASLSRLLACETLLVAYSHFSSSSFPIFLPFALLPNAYTDVHT